MTDILRIVIDLTKADRGSSPDELEEAALFLADEMSEGNIVESAHLVRQTDLPEGAKTGALAFVSGVLTAEISRENLKKTMDFLGNRFYGKTLTLEYKADGLECSLEYRNEKEMAQALSAIAQLESLRVHIKHQ
jgi:hypothetical protein